MTYYALYELIIYVRLTKVEILYQKTWYSGDFKWVFHDFDWYFATLIRIRIIDTDIRIHITAIYGSTSSPLFLSFILAKYP